MSSNQLAVEFNEALAHVAAKMDAESFIIFLMSGIVTNTIGHISDEDWARCMDVKPCGEAICDCHLLRQRWMQTLNEMREDWKTHAPQSITA